MVEDEESMDESKSDAEKNETSADSGDEEEDTSDDDEEDEEEMVHKNDANLDEALKKFDFLKNEKIEDEEDAEEDEESIYLLCLVMIIQNFSF